MSHEARTIDVERLSIPAGSGWARLPLIGLVLGGIGVLLSFWLRQDDPEQFAYSWLVAFLYFLSLALGALFFVLLHYATKSGWGVVVRRLAENTMSTIPLFILLALPIAFGVHDLFHWSHADAMANDEILQGKQAFLNTGFFYARMAAYFAIWTLLALWFARTSRRQDLTGDARLTKRLIFFSGPSILLFAITITFAAFDWIMSLDPHWYSTMFGVYYFAGSLVGIFALLVVLAAGLHRAGYLQQAVTVEHFHDLGKLLFAFMVFWSYIAFCQYFLIWYANIPEETLWFMHRSTGSWASVTLLLGVGHFAIPFLFLMPRTFKRKKPFLVTGALWMLFMHFVDIHWLVMPTLHSHDVHLTLLDFTTLIGVGGLFLAALGWFLRRSALVPLHDPRLEESLSFENV